MALFSTPNTGEAFQIEDRYLILLKGHNNLVNKDYYSFNELPNTRIIPIESISPPTRSEGIPWFPRIDLVLGRMCQGIELDPIELNPEIDSKGRYTIYDGFHRYYMSIVMGFKRIPTVYRAQFSYEN